MDAYAKRFWERMRRYGNAIVGYIEYLIEFGVAVFAQKLAEIRESRICNAMFMQGRDGPCTHESLKVDTAVVTKTKFGYSYWNAMVSCRDCETQWRVQARTAGYFSQERAHDVQTSVFKDSSL